RKNILPACALRGRRMFVSLSSHFAARASGWKRRAGGAGTQISVSPEPLNIAGTFSVGKIPLIAEIT
ncbi:MAG TPA: hypothetical protein VEG60_20840, partial [Candidatus Binatia bacterium]|nr:hypothetical protein [Candidatus Binatia bacterium]